MEVHEAANLFPMMDDGDYARLREGIREYGLKHPILLLGGKVLDGRNRLKACEELGVEPRFENLPDDTDAISYSLQANLNRRHLTESQRSMVASKLATMKHGGDRKSEEIKGSIDPLIGKSIEDAAKTLSVGRASVVRARKVLSNAIPEVVKMVERGELSVSAAAKVADLPRKEQAAAARGKGKRARVRAVKPPAGEQEPEGGRESKGVGVALGYEAVNSLKRIPKNDPLRERGFQIVTDWIRRHR